jgi:hypothetical protein
VNVMEPVKWALQALDIIESETRDLVPAGAPSTPKSETDVEIAPLVQQVGATSIAEIEKMIGELQEAKDFLQSEGERVQRETEQYTTLTQMASASVKIISDTVAKWREAGHPLETIRRQLNSRSRPSCPRTAPVRRACRINHHSPRDKSEPGPEGRTSEACWQASKCGDWPRMTSIPLSSACRCIDRRS